VTVAAATAVPTTAETIIATLPGLSTSRLCMTYRLVGVVLITAGVGTQRVIVRLRRGTAVTGTVVGDPQVVAARYKSTIAVGATGEDMLGEVVAQQYVLTVQQAAATGDGSVTWAELVAISS